MKKFIYLCGMLLLSMNMMAQIDLNDKNWQGTLIENFNDASDWIWDTNNFSNSKRQWKAYLGHRVDTYSHHHIYQFTNSCYDSINGTMNLVAEYDTNERIPDREFYIPDNGSCFDSIYYDNKFYFSGAIEYVKNIWFPDQGKFQYGYFEILCKLPIHQGAFPAFWLQAANTNPTDPYYEEIDIFEYSWSLGNPTATWLPVPNPNPTYAGDPRLITTGIYHNLHGQYSDPNTDTYARNYPRLNGQDSISGWHTYSCEWMPDHVYWYLDGNLVNSYFDRTHIPRHHLTLKTNYAIDGYAVEKIYDNNHVLIGYNPVWRDSDTMTIGYIRVYQLKWDCNNDKVIVSQNDLDSFILNPYVKKSISIASNNGNISLESTDKVTFRVVDSFEITGAFQADSGCEFTVIMQECPE